MQQSAARRHWIAYWRLALRERPITRRYPLYRVIPPVITGALQFYLFRAERPSKEMWILILIVVGVYAALYAVEICWNVVSLSPVRLHLGQIETITELNRKNADLELLAHPPISPQQDRQRTRVRNQLRDFTKEEKLILLRIIDDGGIPTQIMTDKSGWEPQLINATISKAMGRGLMEIQPGQGPQQIVPSLKDTLRFIIESEEGNG